MGGRADRASSTATALTPPIGQPPRSASRSSRPRHADSTRSAGRRHRAADLPLDRRRSARARTRSRSPRTRRSASDRRSSHEFDALHEHARRYPRTPRCTGACGPTTRSEQGPEMVGHRAVPPRAVRSGCRRRTIRRAGEAIPRALVVARRGRRLLRHARRAGRRDQARLHLRSTAFTPVVFYGTGIWHWQVRANFKFGSTPSSRAATPGRCRSVGGSRRRPA